MKPRALNVAPRCLLAFILAFGLCLPTAGIASAANPDSQPASAEAADSAIDPSLSESPNAPTEEDVAAWNTDGTLEERIAFEESLGNDQVSSTLIEQAKARTSGTRLRSSSSGDNLPANDSNKVSMNTVGEAHVLALHVDFPVVNESGEQAGTLGFKEGDTLEALQNLIGEPLSAPNTEDTDGEGNEEEGGATDGNGNGEPTANPNAGFAPYDSLHAYYQRSSYGKLNISGTAFAYTAKHPRSYYNDENINELFAEALTALDDETKANVDFEDYDANDDGVIDTVYLHFAGENSGWGSTWWSNRNYYYGEDVTFDGKKIGSIITLHLPSNGEEGLRTAIHETGHALGLPDYYSYNSSYVEKDPSYRTGILTFDMMNNNIGDHNAYSKWLLGWIDESKITRIVANENGITVKRGTGEAEAISTDDATGDFSVEAALKLLATDSMADCGGFIAISNDEALLGSTGLFSSFYLLEYNDFAGNQIVRYHAGYDEDWNSITEPIPTGFRLFRVQAELDETGLAFEHMNKEDDVHNQFIELVDHDGSAQHIEYSGLAGGTGQAPYECMMTAGDAVTPQGYPSTNFNENINIGFTGLTIEVLECGESQGKVRVSWSAEHKPDISADALTLQMSEPRGVQSTDVVELVGSIPLVKPNEIGSFPYAETPYVKVQNKFTPFYLDVTQDNVVTVSYSMPPELFIPGEEIEIVFPAGNFYIGKDDNGTDVLSDEIRVSLTIGNVAEFDYAGIYENATSDSQTISNAVTCANGSTYFAVLDGGEISLREVDNDDPTKVTSLAIEGLDSSNASMLKLVALEEGVCLIVQTWDSTVHATRWTAHWIDLEAECVTAESALYGPNPESLSAVGNALVTSYVAEDYYYQRYYLLQIHEPDGKSAESTNVQVSTWNIGPAQNVFEIAGAEGQLAFTGFTPYDEGRRAYVIDLVKLLGDTVQNEYGQPIGFYDLPAVANLDASRHSGLSALAYDGNAYLGIAYQEPEAVGSPDTSQNGASPSETLGSAEGIPAWKGGTDLEAYLVRFDQNGSLAEASCFSTFPMQGASFDAITISANGVPAVEVTLDPDMGGDRRTFFFEDGLASASSILSDAYSTNGTWLSTGSWFEIGFFNGQIYTETIPGDEGGAVGSPDLLDEGTDDSEGMVSGSRSYPVRYLVCSFSDDGGASDGEGNESGSTGNGESEETLPGDSSDTSTNDSGLSRTGDATSTIVLACLAAAVAALVTAFAAKRKCKV